MISPWLQDEPDAAMHVDDPNSAPIQNLTLEPNEEPSGATNGNSQADMVTNQNSSSHAIDRSDSNEPNPKRTKLV